MEEKELLTHVRIEQAVTQQKLNELDRKFDSLSRDMSELRKELAPIVERVTTWKGALTVIVLIAGGIGAGVATMIKKWLGIL